MIRCGRAMAKFVQKWNFLVRVIFLPISWRWVKSWGQFPSNRCIRHWGTSDWVTGIENLWFSNFFYCKDGICLYEYNDLYIPTLATLPVYTSYVEVKKVILRNCDLWPQGKGSRGNLRQFKMSPLNFWWKINMKWCVVQIFDLLTFDPRK